MIFLEVRETLNKKTEINLYIDNPQRTQNKKHRIKGKYLKRKLHNIKKVKFKK